MKIYVQSYNNGNKISEISKSSLPKIKNPTVLSIIDNAIFRNNTSNYSGYSDTPYNNSACERGNISKNPFTHTNHENMGQKL